jgi:3-oxoacyl-ACP reductase-like protein
MNQTVGEEEIMATAKEETMPASNIGTKCLDDFKGKRVLVTGGTKGAGKAIAARFLQGGATVAITARSLPTEKTALTSSRQMSRHPKVRRT